MPDKAPIIVDPTMLIDTLVDAPWELNTWNLAFFGDIVLEFHHGHELPHQAWFYVGTPPYWITQGTGIRDWSIYDGRMWRSLVQLHPLIRPVAIVRHRDYYNLDRGPCERYLVTEALWKGAALIEKALREGGLAFTDVFPSRERPDLFDVTPASFWVSSQRLVLITSGQVPGYEGGEA